MNLRSISPALAAVLMLAFAAGSTAPARAASGGLVDVLLSVGQPSGTSQCQPDSEGACDLVRVRVDLAKGVATKVATLVSHGAVGASGSGVAQPAVSPDGTRVAWLERGGTGVQLWAKAFTESSAHLLVKSGREKNGGSGLRPEWPEWVGNDTLLFSSKTGSEGGKDQKTIFAVATSDLSAPGKPTARAGAGVSGWTGVQDPAVYTGSVGSRLVAFGPVPGGDKESYQLEMAPIDGAGVPTAAPVVIAAGVNAAGEAIQGCHHPAWNASGNRIMCMVHRPSESVGGLATKLLYAYGSDSKGSWGLIGRAFEPQTPAAAGLAVASQLTTAAGCQALSYKYAQYCQSDDYVVATLYCSKEAKSSGRGAEIGASRVLLIRTSPVQYFDVTGMVEASQGLGAGALSSFTGTCRAAD